MNFALPFLGIIWGLITVPLAALLLIVAATWDGRAFALAAICAGLAPFLGALGWALDRKRWLKAAAVLGLVTVVLASLLMIRAPSGKAAPDAKIQHLYANGSAHFSRYALGNLLPEADQLMLCFTAASFVDPLFTASQSRSLKGMTADLYRELERDPAFHALGSTMPDVYADVLGSGIRLGHTYLYVPPGVDRTRPTPAIVFLHGSGGNFKAYLWVLSRLADRQKIILIAPSFGMGNWSQPSTDVVLDRALKTATQKVALDLTSLHLMGLSNGGLGVSQLAASHGSQFRSFIFLSPVFDEGEISSTRFATHVVGKPILILTGALDDRVPLSYVQDSAAELKRAGALVTLESFPNANHFLVFSERDALIAKLGRWISTLDPR